MRSQNRELLIAVKETPEETELRVGSALYQRARIAAVTIEAVKALRPKMIQIACDTFHLHPFYGTPNYDRDKELRLCSKFLRKIEINYYRKSRKG